MSASDNLHPVQLGMFMQAKTIHAGNLNETYGEDRRKPGLMRSKQAENVKWGRDKAFADGGVRTPLEMSPGPVSWSEWNRQGPSDKFEPTLMEGHHRLAWAMNRDPNTELPVTWTDKYVRD